MVRRMCFFATLGGCLAVPCVARATDQHEPQSYSLSVFASESKTDLGWVDRRLSPLQRALGFSAGVTWARFRCTGYLEILSPPRDTAEYSVTQRSGAIAFGYTMVEHEAISVWAEAGAGYSDLTVNSRGDTSSVRADLADYALGYTYVFGEARPGRFSAPFIGARLGYRRQFEDAEPTARNLSGGYLQLAVGLTTGWRE